MNLKYEIREIMYNDKKDDIVFDFEKKYEILSTFLSADVQPFSSYIFEAIDKVLSGESGYEELNGNVCGVEIHKDKTQIYDNLAEDGMGNWCEIETTELRELVEIWCNELKKFKEHNK
ncbi:hypothetical protein [Clostridium sp. HBUAS56017]|uniref:hypothetical protein n=1 Tax=Clostridium sp. HBUAS56017 TaxID=2571128 RepID=UPI001A9C1029|nr:hypothetical protein [Clostridium sp. HBUAS56017]